VRFAVTDVHCRTCGERIDVRPPDGLTPGEILAECERQAEATHVCSAKDDMRAPDEPAVP
jgi:hypothetical protein